MDLKNAGLILEGGGLRGVYTSGALRFFMDKGLYFPYVIGVSMGACNAANYISRQPERNRIVNIRYVNDFRYLSYCRMLLGGELFGMDFIFDTIPNSLVPFDFNTFLNNRAIFITVVTDCENGEAVFYEKKGLGKDCLKVLKASCSLPFVAKPVHYQGRVLMDGGLSDSIPIRKSIDDGNTKNVLILTRPKGYRKTASRFAWLTRLLYPRYRGLHATLSNRHTRYNDTMDLIDQLEKEEKIFIVRPKTGIKAGRVERNKDTLYAAYDKGYDNAASHYSKLRFYLDNKNVCKP